MHAEVIERITRGIEAHGLRCLGVTESPIKGDKSGNTEFLAHFVLEDPNRAAAGAATDDGDGSDDDDAVPSSPAN